MRASKNAVTSSTPRIARLRAPESRRGNGWKDRFNCCPRRMVAIECATPVSRTASAMSFFANPNSLHFDGKEIASLGEYKAWFWHKQAGGDRANYPEFSGKILDLKDGHESAVEYFFGKLDSVIPPKVALAVVPSHDPAKPSSALRKLAQVLAASKSRKDATSCLVRHTKIHKLAGGGDRSYWLVVN
jgi:hypothetical protein